MTINFTNSSNEPSVQAGNVDDEKPHRLNMMLPAPLYRQLHEKARQTGLSIPMLVRFALVEHPNGKKEVVHTTAYISGKLR